MKNPLLTFCLTAVLFGLSFIVNSQTHQFVSEKINCTYETNEGRIHGKYTSYYANGVKKAEGNFENNYRSGKWKVWDSTGILRIQRVYRNPFEFYILMPDETEERPINLLVPPIYSLQYNSDNYLEEFTIDGSMVIWAKRIWRWIPIENNTLLFDNNCLFNTLSKNVLNGNLTAYNSVNDLFNKELNITTIDTSHQKIIGFKIKEDHFYDNKRFVSERRILGICPVAINTISNDTTDLFWLRFPGTRKYLATQFITEKSEKQSINTLDDLFFFRDFNSTIYKEDNIYNRTITEYKTGPDILKEAEKIEINLIEMEHDIWLTGF